MTRAVRFYLRLGLVLNLSGLLAALLLGRIAAAPYFLLGAIAAAASMSILRRLERTS